MLETNNPKELRLSFDENRLVRLFRCMSKVDRSIQLYKLHQQLMKTHTVLPELERFTNWKEHKAEEMSSHINERLNSARPFQTEIANAHELTLDLSEMAWGCDFAEVLLGTEELQNNEFVESLSMAYLQAHHEAGAEPCYDPNDDDQIGYLNEEAANYLCYWRENIVRGLEQSVARKANPSS